ncbi:SagB family peptide dehydrogenase [Bacillus sp. RG28]|uniref:SagB family peptide dehydrogenase n=1 Tax=Gottfriedia endophytica TaxID=2820819 RepID=A0A940SKN9_9BACI|nr:SagB family peptide dehydrogenase [Gottfriedia endophytica]MBP0726646.1 SagB family peptide dehydrogenase [Gottfriedia endophytica]
MSLETFLDILHYHTDQAAPDDWEANWEDAPLPYKLYRHLPTIPFSSEIPLSLDQIETSNNINLDTIGHFLFYTYGLTQLCHLGMPITEKDYAFMQRFRRFAPSGGGLYPNELYVYLKIEDVPTGVYHYDVAHHRLVLLREGNYDSFVSRALGNRSDVSSCFATVFISTMFWKNFFKYHNFSYRLQGLDAGVLIGQLQEVAKRYKFHTSVHYQFLDRAVNHLLGLSETEESVYAVIPLGEESYRTEFDLNISYAELCHEIPKIDHQHYVRSKQILEYPMLLKMNEAAFLDSTQSFQNVKRKQSTHHLDQAHLLPRVERIFYNFADACKNRYSPEMDFTFKKLSHEKLIQLLYETAASFPYRNDGTTNDVSLYLTLFGIEGIQNGAYVYNGETHTLQLIQQGDFRLLLQNAMTTHNLSLFQVPLCVHIVGDRQHAKEELGYRGYRIQQMEAGILSQKLLLSAASIGLGGHPLLGFDVETCDNLYRLNEQGKTTLIQIPIGFYEERAWLRGSLGS